VPPTPPLSRALAALGLMVLIAACSRASNSITPVAGQLPDQPSSVTPPSVVGPAIVDWPITPGLTYNLHWSTTDGVTPATGMKIPDVTPPYVFNNVTEKATYYFAVTASNAVGKSTPSAKASPTPPWAAAGGWSGLSLAYRSTAAGVTPATGTKIANARSSPHYHWGRSNGTSYYSVVAPVYGATDRVPSPEIVAVPPDGYESPTEEVATAGDGQVTIAWRGLTTTP